MNAHRTLALILVILAAGCGDHRMSYVSGVWPVDADQLANIDMAQEDLSGVARTTVDTRAGSCLEPVSGGGLPVCYDEPLYDTVAIVHFVNGFPDDPADTGAGALTLTSFVLELVSDEAQAPALPLVTSTIRVSIPAATQRNVVFPLAGMEAKRIFSMNSNLPHMYVAGYRIKVEGRDALTASTPIELGFMNGCPEKTQAVSSCP